MVFLDGLGKVLSLAFGIQALRKYKKKLEEQNQLSKYTENFNTFFYLDELT